MAKNIVKYSVFISSPGDLSLERDLVTEICNQLTSDLGSIHGFALDPVRWETHTHSAVGERSQSVISSQIGDYDIYLGIMGFNFGTPTGAYGSGTEEEFQDALSYKSQDDRLSIQFYFSSAKVDLEKIDLSEYKKVQSFRQEIGSKGLYYRKFEDLTQLQVMVRKGIINEVYKKLKEDDGKGKSSSQVFTYRQLRPYELLKNLKAEFENDPDLSSHLLMQEASEAFKSFASRLNQVGAKVTPVTKAVQVATRELNLFTFGKKTKQKLVEKSFSRALEQMEAFTRWISYEVVQMELEFRGAMSDFQRAGLILKSTEGFVESNFSSVFDTARQTGLQFLSLADSLSFSGGSIPELPEVGGRWEGNRKAFRAVCNDFSEFLRISVDSIEETRATILSS